MSPASSSSAEREGAAGVPARRRVRPVNVAFVAGGGAVKAYAYHLGVLRGLQVDGFHFRSGPRWEPSLAPAGNREIDIYVGSSAGGCVATAIACGRSVAEQVDAIMARGKTPVFGYRTLFVPVAPNPVRYLKRIARRWRLGGLRPQNLIDAGGLFSTVGVERYFRRNVLPTNRFGDLAADLFLVATQVNNARKVAFGPLDSVTDGGSYDPVCAFYNNVEVPQALAAAIAVPPVFVPAGVVNPSSGKVFHYYDGEVREPVSADIAREAGAEHVIVSSIWNPYVYDERVGTLADLGMSAVGVQALHQAVEQKVLTDQQQASRYERLLSMIEQHDRHNNVPSSNTEAFKFAVGRHLGHRRIKTLYITPDPADHQFFLNSSFFRFNRRLIQRCVDTGLRAYQRAVALNPDFLPSLDRALGEKRAAEERETGT